MVRVVAGILAMGSARGCNSFQIAHYRLQGVGASGSRAERCFWGVGGTPSRTSGAASSHQGHGTFRGLVPLRCPFVKTREATRILHAGAAGAVRVFGR